MTNAALYHQINVLRVALDAQRADVIRRETDAIRAHTARRLAYLNRLRALASSSRR